MKQLYVLLGLAGMVGANVCVLPATQSLFLKDTCETHQAVSTDKIAFEGLVGERENIQIMVMSTTTTMLKPSVSLAVEASSKLYQVGYVNCTATTRYPGSGGGWRSDPLLEIPAEGIQITESQPVVLWLSVRITDPAVGGVLTVGDVQIPISVVPWMAALPSNVEVHQSFGEIWSFDVTKVEQLYGPAYNETVARNFYDLMTDQLLPPDSLYKTAPYSNFTVYEYLINTGAYLLNIAAIGQAPTGCPNPYTPEWINATINSIAPTIDKILAFGGTTKPYVYGFDEQPISCEPNIRALYGAVKARWGDKVSTVAALNWKNMPIDLPVDIWVLQYQYYTLNQATAWQAAGHQIFLYHCIEPSGADYLNTFIEHNRTQGRQLYWYGAMHEVDGWLYYATDIWNAYPGTKHTPIKRINGSPMTDFPPANYIWAPRTDIFANGDGQFLYPGVGGMAVPSARLLLQRDAVEDVVLLKLALAKDKVQTMSIINKIVRSPTDHTDDPVQFEQARIAISKICVS
eukprot:TRINITY_DN5913_c0_g1_i1.p1 TRINITY_DN5913_c0_g1~~TRINITY_DN5913_c0_g1_i1.p1  ORF type:complete len:515 (+),score=62.55 TRINITY_DN5913_c0_g1_i1:207-1751(+)